MTSNYMLISNHTANKLCEFSPTTHKLLLRGSTTKCVIKIALTIILYGAPLLVSLGWDLAVALKDRVKVISAKPGNNDSIQGVKDHNKDAEKKPKPDSNDQNSKKCVITHITNYYNKLPLTLRSGVITLIGYNVVSKTVGINGFVTAALNVATPVVRSLNDYVVWPMAGLSVEMMLNASYSTFFNLNLWKSAGKVSWEISRLSVVCALPTIFVLGVAKSIEDNNPKFMFEKAKDCFNKVFSYCKQKSQPEEAQVKKKYFPNEKQLEEIYNEIGDVDSAQEISDRAARRAELEPVRETLVKRLFSLYEKIEKDEYDQAIENEFNALNLELIQEVIFFIKGIDRGIYPKDLKSNPELLNDSFSISGGDQREDAEIHNEPDCQASAEQSSFIHSPESLFRPIVERPRPCSWGEPLTRARKVQIEEDLESGSSTEELTSYLNAVTSDTGDSGRPPSFSAI